MSSSRLKHGDFSSLAKSYNNRPGYSLTVLRLILNDLIARTGKGVENLVVIDVGAGTGKLTENLLELGLHVTAIEPNEAMREEGSHYLKHFTSVEWKAGSCEHTGLESGIADWFLMGSSFHWVQFESGISEINRILKPGGCFTAIWNPRNIGVSELHTRIESRISLIVPNLKRVSSGMSGVTDNLTQKLLSAGCFKDVFFVESEYEIRISKDRYMGAWQSTNDIQVQAGDRWKDVLAAIEDEIKDMDEIIVPYKTRAWTGVKGD